MEMLRPGVYPVEVDFSAYVKALSTSTFGVAGVFEKGAVTEPILVTSLEDAKRKLGAYLDDSGHFGMLALKNFFENGGSRAQVVRVTHLDGNGDTTALPSTVTLDDRDADGDLASNPTLQVDAATPGAWADGIQIVISASTAFAATGFDLEVQDAAGATLEQFKDLLMDPASDDYAEKRINDVSAYIIVTDLESPDPTDVRPAEGTFALAAGSDGTVGLVTADYVSALDKLDSVDVNFISVPGETDAEIAGGLISKAENRKDCIAILEVPQGLSAAEMVEYRTGSGAFVHTAFNSSFGALYGPWIKAAHPVTGRTVVLPPSGFVAGIFARNDAEGAVWTAPAGPNRATLRGALAPEARLSKGEMDVLYPASVNPIAVVAGALMVHGQKTLQLKASATDRVNVRRLMAYVEKSVSDSAQFLVFEPNNKATWEAFKRLVNPFLQRIRDRGGFYDFVTICDESINTPAVIDANQMAARIMVKPTKTAEFISIEFAIAPSGADFSEL